MQPRSLSPAPATHTAAWRAVWDVLLRPHPSVFAPGAGEPRQTTAPPAAPPLVIETATDAAGDEAA
jgi:hypothetical protein